MVSNQFSNFGLSLKLITDLTYMFVADKFKDCSVRVKVHSRYFKMLKIYVLFPNEAGSLTLASVIDGGGDRRLLVVTICCV